MNEPIGIDCRKFKIDDFPIYQSWFRDPELNQQLGPMDETWLKHIISDKTGAQYSFFSSDTLIAVAGVVFPNTHSTYYYLTDIAVKPTRRSQGIGTQVLGQLLSRPDLKQTREWRAAVSPENIAGIRLLRGSGWRRVISGDQQGALIMFEWLGREMR